MSENEQPGEMALGNMDEVEDEPKSKRFHLNYGKLDLDVYSPADIAERIGCTKTEILRQINIGALRAKRFGGPMGYRSTKQDLLDWLAS